MALMLCANSLLVGAALVVCFFNTGVHPAFKLDEFGDVIFEDPAIAGPEDYQATEGNYVFFAFLIGTLVLSTHSVFVSRGQLYWYFIFVGMPAVGLLGFKVPRLLFKCFFLCCKWAQKVVICLS
mgnify:CR=1 FL=1